MTKCKFLLNTPRVFSPYTLFSKRLNVGVMLVLESVIYYKLAEFQGCRLPRLTYFAQQHALNCAGALYSSQCRPAIIHKW